MEVEYRKDLQHSYLVVKTDHEIPAEQYYLRMLEENTIDGLLQCSTRHMNEELLLYYDITSCQSLKELSRCRKLSGKEILFLIRCLVQTWKQMEEYLLPAELICLQAEFIYTDIGKSVFYFCCIPEENTEHPYGLREFLEAILPQMDHQVADGLMGVYDLYHYTMEETVTSEGLQKRLEGYEREEPSSLRRDLEVPEIREKEEREPERSEQEQQKHLQALDAFFSEEEEEERVRYPWLITGGTVGTVLYLLSGWYLLRNWKEFLWIWIAAGFFAGGISGICIFCKRKGEQKEEKKYVEEQSRPSELSVPWKEEDPEEEAEDWEAEEYTQLLSPVRERGYILEEQFPEKGRIIRLEKKGIQTLGQQRGKVDIVLPSAAVSRLHAWIRQEEEGCYVRDMNSRNGTWVNQNEVSGEQETMIKEGDEIRFADLIYRLRRS